MDELDTNLAKPKLLPGWIISIASTLLLLCVIFIIDQFLIGYHNALLIQRIEHHLESESSAKDLSEDPLLAPIINRDNRQAIKQLRILSADIDQTESTKDTAPLNSEKSLIAAENARKKLLSLARPKTTESSSAIYNALRELAEPILGPLPAL